MKKIHCLLAIALMLTVFSVFGDERIELFQGKSQTITLPFVLKDYHVQPTGTSVFRVQELDSNLRIIAGTIGEATLIVNGKAGEQRIYAVSVKSDEVYREWQMIQVDLEGLPELELIPPNEGRIVIRGTVTNPEHWALLQKVLPTYKRCTSFAKFTPSADALLDLKKRIGDAGFTFAEKQEDMKDGELFLSCSQNTIMISGRLFSNSDIAKLNQVFNTAPIMNMDGDLVKKIIDLSLVKAGMNVQVAYVSLADSDNFNKSGDLIPTATFDLNYFRRWLDGSTQDKTFAFGSSMNGTISMLQSDMVTKVSDQANVPVQNGGKGAWKFGGSIKVPVSGTENGDLKDIDYGCNVNIENCELTGKESVQVLYKLSWTEVETDPKGNYVTKTVDISPGTPVSQELGKTYIVAHHKKDTEIVSAYGLPVLRDIPWIGWLFGGYHRSNDVMHILILGSVEREELTAEKDLGLKSQDVLDETEKPASELIKDPDAISKGIDRIIE